jgi:hypothetical protein
MPKLHSDLSPVITILINNWGRVLRLRLDAISSGIAHTGAKLPPIKKENLMHALLPRTHTWFR